MSLFLVGCSTPLGEVETQTVSPFSFSLGTEFVETTTRVVENKRIEGKVLASYSIPQPLGGGFEDNIIITKETMDAKQSQGIVLATIMQGYLQQTFPGFVVQKTLSEDLSCQGESYPRTIITFMIKQDSPEGQKTYYISHGYVLYDDLYIFSAISEKNDAIKRYQRFWETIECTDIGGAE